MAAMLRETFLSGFCSRKDVGARTWGVSSESGTNLKRGIQVSTPHSMIECFLDLWQRGTNFGISLKEEQPKQHPTYVTWPMSRGRKLKYVLITFSWIHRFDCVPFKFFRIWICASFHSSRIHYFVICHLLWRTYPTQDSIPTSGTHRQITAGFVMAREAGITSFTK